MEISLFDARWRHLSSGTGPGGKSIPDLDLLLPGAPCTACREDTQGESGHTSRFSNECQTQALIRCFSGSAQNEDGSRSLAIVKLATDAFGAMEDADIYYMRLALNQATEAFRRGEIPVSGDSVCCLSSWEEFTSG